MQPINKFHLELRLKETSAEKLRKPSMLSLDDEEWEHVSLFCNLLQVGLTVTASMFLVVEVLTIHICSSTRMMPSKHFLLPRFRHFKMHSPHWRRCTPHGKKPPLNLDIPLLYQHSLREWTSSTLTTSVLLHPMLTLWPWVFIYCFFLTPGLT